MLHIGATFFYLFSLHFYFIKNINVHKKIIPFFEPKKLKLTDLTPVHIHQYINHQLKTVSPNTVRKHLVNMSKCLDAAVRQNIIAVNPVKRVELPKKQKYTGAKYYNEKQIAQLLDCSKGDPLETVILLTVFYGLRRSEVLGLKCAFFNSLAGKRMKKIHSCVGRVRKRINACAACPPMLYYTPLYKCTRSSAG